MKIAATLLLFSLLASHGALAQDIDCDNALDQASMNFCADRDFKAFDEKLNETYVALEKNVSKEGLDKLKKAQRAWVAYRDAQCDFDTAGTEGASVNPMVVALCRDALTQAQTKQLNAQLNCEEGNLSCGRQ